MSNATFIVGNTYQARSACSYDCIWTFVVKSRTAKFVTLVESNGETRRVGVRDWRGVETCSPFGSYSMAPVLMADRPTV